MMKKLLFTLYIFVLTFSFIHANDIQKNENTVRAFTVTSIALDAQNERLQTEEDTNETIIEGGDTETNNI